MHAFTRTLFASTFALTLCAWQPGCTAGSSFTAENEDEGESPSAAIVALTPIDGARAPVLERVAGDFEVVDIRELVGEGPALVEIEGARRAIAGSAAVVADAGRLTDADLAAYGPLLRDAQRRGVPIVLENVRGEHKAKMTAIVGLGLEADVVVVEPSAGGSRCRLTVLGDDSEILTETTVEPPKRLAAPAERDPAKPRASARSHGDDVAGVVSGRSPGADPETAAVEVTGKLQARVQAGGHDQIPMSGTILPEGTYKFYDVDFSTYTWSPTSGQTATMNVDFEVELMASSQPEGKFMVVRPKGSGVHPGTLAWNHDEDRGYFQESVVAMVMVPLHLSVYDHAPAATSRASTFWTSNGVSFVADTSGNTSFSVGATDTDSVSLSNFGVTDASGGPISLWVYEMTSAGGDTYNSWDDLVNEWGFLKSLPSLAKSTLQPKFETIYRTQSNTFDGTAAVSLHYTQYLRNTWLDWYLFYSDVHTTLKSMSRTSTLDVDFGQVNIPQDGTAPFTETFSGGMGNWSVINEGIEDASPSWSITSGAARETGNAYDIYAGESVVEKRGTYLWNDRTFFGQGSLEADVYAGDNDGFGLIYGVQGMMESYYRVSFDRERSFARLVRVDDGVFTVLAQDLAYLPPLGAWTTVRVERSGSTHRVYVDGALVLTAIDSTFTTGSVALYSWGMSDVRFDDVRISLD